MKYLIDFNEFHDPAEAAQYITENLNDSPFDEMLNDCYGDIDICGYSYIASIAFYRVDPIAYNCSMSDYYDGLTFEIENEIERMNDGDSAEFYGFTVEAVEDEENEGENE